MTPFFSYSISASVIKSVLEGSEVSTDCADNVFNVVDRFANAGTLLAYKDAEATERYVT